MNLRCADPRSRCQIGSIIKRLDAQVAAAKSLAFPSFPKRYRDLMVRCRKVLPWKFLFGIWGIYYLLRFLLLDSFPDTTPPLWQVIDVGNNGLSQLGQFIFHLRRHNRIDYASYHTRLFQFTHYLSEHLVGNLALYAALQNVAYV